MIPVDQTRRARFEAVRRAAFADMVRTSARMRLIWVVPFNVLVLAVLVTRGLAGPRALVYGGYIVLTIALFVVQAMRPKGVSSFSSFVVGFLGYAVGIAATGGLASPLVPLGAPILVAASVVLEPARAKAWFFGLAVVVFVMMALAARTPIGSLVAPLATRAEGGASAEFIVVSCASLVFMALTLSKFGRHIAGAYERIAFELMARREELCTENEDRTRALEGIAARLAHEVKNPLAAIKGLSTHMARNSTDPKTAERLSIVAAEADRLQAIVEGFLDFSRGLDDLHPAPTKPYELARELTLLLETRAADAGVTLEVVGDASATLEADPRKLRQALLNLVLNAMQASPKGEHVMIEVGRTCPMSYMTTIRVIDHGPGMTPEVIERIRKPYFTTREGGTGLGVAVARGLIEQHGGSLDYESAPGKGTTVTVRLPLNAGTPQHPVLPKVACGVAHARGSSREPKGKPWGQEAPGSLTGAENETSHEEPIGAKI
jgi:signal transduction histidine kinase